MAGQRILDPFIGVRIPAPEPIQRAIGGQSFSSMSPTSPRATLVHALTASVASSLDVGDTKSARIALDALNALVNAASPTTAAIDLADERSKREPTK
jgi:hypothetical protein